MIHKQILPESFNFDMPSVELIGVGSKGLDKTAMVKRASAFDDVLEKLEKKANRTYLHVITTGAYETYGANANGDAFNGDHMEWTFPYPKEGMPKTARLDGGLKKYHDSTYMNGAAVYQEHQTKRAGVDPSGEIVAARYNEPMKRGELIIAVDTNKWAPRLQKKASGKNIYLSIGCDVLSDFCSVCNNIAKTASQHCDHFKHHRGELYDCGVRSFVFNDAPHFYDISGVDVPADRIAFVLKKVASGDPLDKTASLQDALYSCGTRTPMVQTKAASLLSKLSRMEKQIQGLIEGDKDIDLEPFKDDEDAKNTLLIKVKGYPSDEVIDSCSRKGILLTPDMLFKILGRDCSDPEDCARLSACDADSCGDLSCMMEELEDDPGCNSILLDGSFDDHLPVDLNLDSLLEELLPELGASNPAIQSKTIRITISGRKPSAKQRKEASLDKTAQEALRRTYARYLISFAAQNDDATCRNALMKIAALTR